MKIVLLSIGKTFQKFVKEGCAEFEKRLAHYINFQAVELPDIKNKAALSPADLMEKEAEKFLSHIKPADILILLDEKGKQLSSRKLASQLNNYFISGSPTIVILIGGAFGTAPSLQQRAHLLLSLSALTFSHQMARLIATEQIYRAMTILRNEKYHND